METETLFLYYINYRSQVVDILAMITNDNIEWIYMKCMQVIYRYFNIFFSFQRFLGRQHERHKKSQAESWLNDWFLIHALDIIRREKTKPSISMLIKDNNFETLLS